VERPKLRVALFLGCLINYVYPEIAEATVAVLGRLGVEVVIPQGQVCCGTPVLSFGDEQAARRLATMNTEALLVSGADHIVTACASCGKTLKSDYEWLVPDQGAALAKKVLDVSELLDRIPVQGARPIERRVTYHDPCHLRWGQNVVAPPRKLLGQYAQYVEMPEAERCCGGGGSFSLFHYDLATRIAAKKLDSIAASGAEVVATNCPGCILHISDRVTAAGMKIPVVHSIQIVEEAMRKG
jgi:glycolate oxidase iron-sulfur subunit